MKLPIVSVSVGKGDLYEVAGGEDGPLIMYCHYVCAVGVDGKDYLHPHGFDSVGYCEEDGFAYVAHGKGEAAAAVLAEKVLRAGMIDLDIWVEDKPSPLSEADLYDEEERARYLGL